MAGKNKGGREVRKPKQDKKSKGTPAASGVLPPSTRRSGGPSAAK